MITTPVCDMFNVNPHTGIAYGYINANNVNSEVLNEIFCNGIDVARLEADIDFAKRYDFVVPEQKESEDYTAYLERVQSDMLDFLNNLGDDVMEEVEEHDREYEEFTGHVHAATVDKTTVLYNTDNNTICVMDGIYVGFFYACSPCCPNAGDLDSAGGSVETYDVPASWRELDY